MKLYYLQNAEAERAYSRDYNAKHRDRKVCYLRNYYKENKKELLEDMKAYRAKNPGLSKKSYDLHKDEINKRRRERYYSDLAYKIGRNARSATSRAVRYGMEGISSSYEILLGCTTQELLKHLSSQFTDGMTWDNYGKWKKDGPLRWNIDHIRPLASFDLSNVADINKCFHYTNLRPLWAPENISKGDKYVQECPAAA